MIGSTTNRKRNPEIDLSGECTIVGFLREKLKNLKNIHT